jgi:hypothetical protein
MVVTEPLKKMILKNVDGQDLYNFAVAEGMVPIRQVAVNKVLNLDVPPEEIIRVFSQED